MKTLDEAIAHLFRASDPKIAVEKAELHFSRNRELLDEMMNSETVGVLMEGHVSELYERTMDAELLPEPVRYKTIYNILFGVVLSCFMTGVTVGIEMEKQDLVEK